MLSRSVRPLAAAAARRPTLAAAVIYALLALVLVGPALVPGHTLSASDYLWAGAPWQASPPPGATGETGLGSNYEMADAALVFQPFTQWARGQLPDVPLWNPHLMAGRPFVANAQSALFSPFTWPMLVLPFWWSLAVVAWLKLFVRRARRVPAGARARRPLRRARCWPGSCSGSGCSSSSGCRGR